METITKVQFYNLIMTCDSELHKLPKHIQQDISALRDCTKNGKAHLLLTYPKGQDKYFLEYVEVDMLSAEEIEETRLHARENRGRFIAI
tara:strand:+ start:186 stop:452 length:267 start_codon:yes stop_codon:yes gene_type:complete